MVQILIFKENPKQMSTSAVGDSEGTEAQHRRFSRLPPLTKMRLCASSAMLSPIQAPSF
jgi:hypothetical protein